MSGSPSGMLVFGVITARLGIGWFVVRVIRAFMYNMMHTTRLLEAGFKLANSPERVRNAQRALSIGDQAVL